VFAAGHSGPTAIAYAARHPDRVSHLILWQTYARGSDWARSPQVQAIRAAADRDWHTYSETAAHTILGWSEGGAARRFAELIRQAGTPDGLRAAFQAFDVRDVTELLPRVQTPTLVLQRRLAYTPEIDVARRLASSIPNARLAVMDGESAEAYLGDWQAVIKDVYDFLGEEKPSFSGPSEGTATILFADIADSTALTERLGDAAFRDMARGLDESLRAIIREHSGRAVEGKLLGDGVLAVFTSARQAIDAALRCGKAGQSGRLALHLGLHAGDVISEEGNVFGGAVNIASRIADQSAPGEVLVSQTVRDLARTSADVSFEDRGERGLKGVSEPVRLFAIRKPVDPSPGAR
jgi:class 3 adenylate cyclase